MESNSRLVTNAIYQLSSLSGGACTYLRAGHMEGTVEEPLEKKSLEYRVATKPHKGWEKTRPPASAKNSSYATGILHLLHSANTV